MAKVMISLDDDLLSRVDNYADANYMSRSGLLSLATTQFLNANETILLVKNLSLAFQKIADSGEVDDDLLSQMKDFERLAKYITTN